MFSDHLIHNAKLQSEWSRTKCYFLRQAPTAPIWIIITMILRCCIVPSHAVMMIISWRVSCNDAECDHCPDAPPQCNCLPAMRAAAPHHFLTTVTPPSPVSPKWSPVLGQVWNHGLGSARSDCGGNGDRETIFGSLSLINQRLSWI